MSEDANRRLVLAKRPSGMVDSETVRLEEADRPSPGGGEALARVRWISIDPTIRTWMDDAPGYLPPIGIGEVVRAPGVAEVVSDEADGLSPGDLVFGMPGWQEYVGVSVAGGWQKLPPGIEPTVALSVLGVTGMTAYFGMLDVGRVKEGDVVVVSGAAGATGSIAGQVARLKGAAKVVGIAGTDEKCAWLVNDLGFAAAVNYKTDDVARRLHEECPDGIDLYWDNVGGELLDIALAQLAMRGRVVLCGAISGYAEEGPRRGPANYRMLIVRRGRMEGFIILDYLDRFPEGQAQMAQWVGEGTIKHAEHIVKGLENAPDALNLLFTGGNTGKVIVEV